MPRELATVGAIEGAIAADGRITGAVRGTAIVLAGVRSAETGAMESVTGVFRAVAMDQAAAADFVFDSSGRVFVLTRISGQADAGEAIVDSAGEFHLKTIGGADVTGTLDAANQTLSMTRRISGGAAITLSGGNETRRARERLVNIATRGVTTSDEARAMTAGFVLSGTAARPVLIRGIGPALESFGVSNALTAARLEVLRDGVPIGSNAGWSTLGAGELAAAARRVAAFPLPADSRDAAVLAVLAPGAYTARVTGGDGIALVEVYDVADAADPDDGIINIATRGMAGAGDAALIAGFVVAGDLPKRVLIRGVGPGLGQFGVPGTLPDPRIALFRGETLLASSDDWESSGSVETAAAFRAAGAFTLQPASKDAALVLHLTPGAYSVHVSGADGQSGLALVEVYQLPGG